MDQKRSEMLTHRPRGIIKWAPFNSLPEFTMQLKEKNKNKETEDDDGEADNRQDDWYFD